MKQKSTVLFFLGLFATLIPFHNATAQQRTKSSKGDLLTKHKHTEKERKDPKDSSSDAERSPYRSIDGVNNNLSRGQIEWGAANILYYRELPAQYGAGDTNNELNGDDRPSAREISNLIIDEPVTQFTERNISSMWYQWGQFLDHDMTLTPTSDTSVPITLPEDEEIFTEDIPFVRSDFRLDSSKREQFNLNTAFIDASVVYGSSTERASWLRTFSEGKLKTSSDDLLPYNTVDGEYESEIDPDAPIMDGDGGGTTKTFVAGEVRASENPVLTSLHTLFVREHNSICNRLVGEGYTDDEEMYQLARKEVGGLIQAITYEDFLPAFGIDIKDYKGYNGKVRPDIMNTFATASYRIGHTLVSDDVIIVDDECEAVGPGEFDLVETFFNPQMVVDHGIAAFLKGATVHDLYQTDNKINDVLRNFLFGDPSSSVRFGLDLGAINIQRGRDHGLPDYNTVRKFYAEKAAKDFSDITSNDTLATNLEVLYGSIDDIDLWVGILAEDLLPEKSVGNTMHTMLKKQFENVRDGDYYFYLNDPMLDDSAKARIQDTDLSDIIKRNTTVTNLPEDIFQTDDCFEEEEEEEDALVAKDSIASSKVAYPNPFNEILNVVLSDSEQADKATIALYSLDGVLMETIDPTGEQENQKEIQINTTSLVPGIYVVKVVSSNGETKSFKVVKSQ